MKDPLSNIHWVLPDYTCSIIVLQYRLLIIISSKKNNNNYYNKYYYFNYRECYYICALFSSFCIFSIISIIIRYKKINYFNYYYVKYTYMCTKKFHINSPRHFKTPRVKTRETNLRPINIFDYKQLVLHHIYIYLLLFFYCKSFL